MNLVKIGKRKITEFSKPFIIAEIGVNHECSLKKAKQLVSQAKKSGADVVKFQTYKAEKIASKFSPSYWDRREEKTKNQFELFKKLDHFNEKEYKIIYRFCKKIGIEFASTPFDLESVDMLNNMVTFFKVSSSDITNFPLLKKVASKKKPIILSTGASTIKEIKEALAVIKKYKNKVILMHCILNYPTLNKNANLRMISSLKKEFPNNLIGYSDHTLPCKNMTNLCTAYSIGATIIEKHFTDNKNQKGNDHYHAMDKNDLKVFLKKSDEIYESLGNHKFKTFIDSEKISRKNARRSIVVTKNVVKGEKITKEILMCKRPGTGIPPKELNKILGKKFNNSLVADTIIRWRNIK